MGIAERESRRVKLEGKSIAAEMIKNSKTKTNEKKGRPKADRETKKRISLAVLPSLYDKVQKIAYVERRSVSDIVQECFETYVKKNDDKLKEYETL